MFLRFLPMQRLAVIVAHFDNRWETFLSAVSIDMKGCKSKKPLTKSIMVQGKSVINLANHFEVLIVNQYDCEDQHNIFS